MNSITKYALKYSVSLITSAVLIYILVASVFYATIFNSDFLISSLNKSDYYNGITYDLKSSLINIGIPSGVSEEFFDSIIDSGSLKKVINKIILKSEGADISGFRNNLVSKLKIYAASHDEPDIDTNTPEVKKFIDNCTDNYRNCLNNLPDTLNIINAGARFFIRYLFPAVTVLIVLLIIQLILNRSLRKFLKWLGFGLLSAVVMTGIEDLLLINWASRGLNLQPAYLGKFIETVIQGTADTLLKLCSIIFVSGMLIVIISLLIRNRAVMKVSEKI